MSEQSNAGLDRSKVDQVAYLARLQIADSEKDKLTSELQAILGFVDQLTEVDTTGVKPMTSVVEINSPVRADKVSDGEYADRILANAPDRVQDFFAVPKVVE